MILRNEPKQSLKFKQWELETQTCNGNEARTVYLVKGIWLISKHCYKKEFSLLSGIKAQNIKRYH